MDTHALASTRSCDLLPRSLVQCRVHDGRSVSIPSSLGKQWSFRVERRRLTLLSSRRRYSIDVRAKKSGPGSTKLKSKEPPAEEEDEQPVQRTKKQIKLPGTVKVPSKGGSRPKDNRTVFVAGATGNVGRRTVRELVKLGYKVRAGVRNVDTAQFLLEEEETKGESKDEEVEEPTKKGVWANFSPEKLFGFLGPKAKQAAQLVELVQCDLEKEDDIEEALGNAGVVICTIGASEKEVLDVTGPYRIDFKATKNLIDAASSAKVNHFILVTSLGTQKFGWPASVLNLFWGVLYWKAKAEKALIESGIPFTIVRPGGMEKPTDAYKETHNLRLFEADSMFGGQVSNLQVAELMASIVGNLNLARNKVLEAVAETTAPLRPTEDLLADISTFGAVKPAKRSDETRETKQAPKQRLQEEKQSQGAQAATDAAQKKTEAVRQKLQNEYESARLKEEEARQEAEAARAQKQEVERKAAELRSKLKAAAQAVREAKALETAVLAAARQGKQLSDRERKDIISSVRAEIEAEEKAVIAKEKAKQDAEKKARQEAEAKVKAKQDAEKKARQEAEAKATKLAAKLKAEAKAKADAEVAEKKRIESEAKAKKEEEKKMKIEAERKAKEEEEEKIRIEAEKKAKEEEEEKLRNEAEKKAKEEEEEKLRIEAEKKAKEEEEEKLRVEAEKKAKEEEEEKLRIEAEKKAKEEEEEKLRVEAEKKAKEEEEEKLRIEAERKAKEEEEEKGQADVRGEAESEAKPKGFRWPWQKDEPEGGAPTTSELGQDTAATEEAETTELPRPSRPLSPYTKFPTLKPPGPPTPPPGPQVQDLVTEGAAKETVEEPVTKEEEEVTPAVVAESSLETQAKRSGAFRWPWEKQDSEGEPTEEEVAAEPLTEETTAGDDPDLAPTINQTTKQEVAVPETTEELTRPSRPLSPYTAYPALKPPTPPTPPKTIKPGEGESEAKLEASQVTPEPSVPVIEAQELTQDELNARAEEEERLKALAAQEAEAVAERERLAVERAKAAASFRWPWGQPEEASQENDVPSVDSVVEPAAETVIEVAGSAATESAESASIPELPQKSRPLSPYTMYPGMKPPRTPSPPKSPTKEPAEAARSEEPQSASAEAENGSATETVEDDGAQVLEPAGAFRWPWEQ
ncbi:hypothetical protein MPTK1_1g27480 [Marchantia polymorpha subsp. ruderalis]|uniref:NAD(P)-binding domain-containing protein n=1 Tax=Marchantia polymorpha subsp. ruderalis TaxID=1480154 RepID=A0AAF6AUV9_MARPO|nr:hypothetical protein Mp_1g27480 [Marchantia polymorpha subsp. ruderalis]